MKHKIGSFSSSQHKLFTVLGVGAASTLLLAATGAERVFAKQFIGESTKVDIPQMVYDPTVQMMIDPITGKPIYEDMKNITVASGLPTITAGCDDCPKKDDDGE